MNLLSKFLAEHADGSESAAMLLGEQCHVVLVAERLGLHEDSSCAVAVLRLADSGPELPTYAGRVQQPLRWWKGRVFKLVTPIVAVSRRERESMVYDQYDFSGQWIRVRWIELAPSVLLEFDYKGAVGAHVEISYSKFRDEWYVRAHSGRKRIEL